MVEKFIDSNNNYNSSDLYNLCDTILVEIDQINSGDMSLRDFWLKRKSFLLKVHKFLDDSELENNQCLIDYFNNNYKNGTNENFAIELNQYLYDKNPIYKIYKTLIFEINIAILVSYTCEFRRDKMKDFLIYSQLEEIIFNFRMNRTTQQQYSQFKSKYDFEMSKLDCSVPMAKDMLYE